MLSDVGRHVPAFLKLHHAGSVAAPATRSITISCPDDCRMSWPSSNEPTSMLLPTFALQAKFLFAKPASPMQLFQRRFTPWPACAVAAKRSDTKSESSVQHLRMATSRRVEARGCTAGATRHASMLFHRTPVPTADSAARNALGGASCAPSEALHSVHYPAPPPQRGPRTLQGARS